jgi:hypothetical protein
MTSALAVATRPRVAACAVVLAAAVALSSCNGGAPGPVPAVAAWRPYQSAGGGFRTEVPSAWEITERGGLGGYETEVRANTRNWIVLRKQFLPGSLETAVLQDATRDKALIGAVQEHYDQIAQTCVSFHGDAPEVSSAASSFAGFGKFTCERKAGRGGPVELQGATVIIIGLNDLYIIDAYADAQSAKVVLAAFDRGVGSFKYGD